MKYEHYKDSGIDWIGPIPAHWYISNSRYFLKILTDYTANGSFGDLAKNVNYIDTPDFSRLVRLTDLREELLNNGVFVNEHSHNYLKKSELFGGEVLFANVGAYAGLVVKMPFINFKATLGPNMFLTKWNEEYIVDDYLVYLYNSKSFNKYLSIIANSAAQPKLNKENIRSLKIVLPPIHEQEAIANFLDEKTAKIDALVQTKEQQIEKLKELRQAKIHQAVTKGLDANAPTKDSGVAWIGEIPAHWVVKRLKHLMRINNGLDYKHVQVDEGYPVIGSGGQFAYASKYLYDGEVLFLGRKGTIDKPLYFKGKFWTVDTMFYCVVNKKGLTKYLYYFSTTIPFKYYSTATALPSMTQSDLNNHNIPIPSIQEQEQIVAYLEEVTGKIDQAIAQKQEQITKLKEYKQSLINDVVTGKVRVC